MQIGETERLQVIRAMLADPVNRLCIESIFAEGGFAKVYPSPARSPDGRFAYVGSLEDFKRLAPSARAGGGTSSDWDTFASTPTEMTDLVGGPSVFVRPIYALPNPRSIFDPNWMTGWSTFEAIIYSASDEGIQSLLFGPFATREEALTDCSVMLLQEFNIIVLKQPVF